MRLQWVHHLDASCSSCDEDHKTSHKSGQQARSQSAHRKASSGFVVDTNEAVGVQNVIVVADAAHVVPRRVDLVLGHRNGKLALIGLGWVTLLRPVDVRLVG